MLSHRAKLSTSLYLNNITLCVFVCITFSLSFYLLMNTCFHVLAVVNNASINLGMCIPFWDSNFYFLWINTQKWNCWIIGKDSDAGRDWGQKEKGTTEDEMTGWHHGLDGRESEWTPGVGDGQGGLACCNSWGRKESDTTERLKWTDGDSNVNFERDLPSVFHSGCTSFHSHQ